MGFEGLEEAWEFLTAHVDYERARDYEYAKLRPDVTFRLAEAVGSPQSSFGCIHIAGTKGKGSTAAFCQSILKSCGLRVGAFFSPHIRTPLERIQIDCEDVDEGLFCHAVSRIAEAEERLRRPITFFEIMTVASLICHAEAGIDVGVYEVGIGGRLDATQVVRSAVSVITRVSYDHMEKLGTTLEEIAGEKCGIIRDGVPVVSALQSPEVQEVIVAQSARRNSPLLRFGVDFVVEGERKNFSVRYRDTEFGGLETSLVGRFQMENAATAIASVCSLAESGFIAPLTTETARDGVGNTRIHGRMEVVSENPLFIVDGAHNGDSVAAALSALREEFSPERILVVFGCSLDKDVVRMVRAMASASVSEVFVVSGFSPRAFPADELSESLRGYGGLLTRPFISVEEAVGAALSEAGENDAVIAFGSFYLVSEVLNFREDASPAG